MGACYSMYNSTTIFEQQFVASLDTGDLVLLQEKGTTPLYISRAGSWTTFTHVGFLERTSPTPFGLCVWHADCRTETGYGVGKARLHDLLLSGRYTAILVRRLFRRLTPDQRDLVHQYACLNTGKIRPLSAPRCVLLMADTASGKDVHRMYCSEFVATMLHVVGLVQPSFGNPLEFRATHDRGLVAEGPLALHTQRQRGGRVGSSECGEGVRTGVASPTSTAVHRSCSTSCLPPSPDKLGGQQPSFLQQQEIAV